MNKSRGRMPVKLFAIGATALSVVGISIGTMMSLALFTDDTDVDNNNFSTGTIVLTTNPTSALFSVSSMMPGDIVYGQLTVSNAGSGQLRYAMTSSSTNADTKDLRSAVTLQVKEKAAGSCASDFTGADVMLSTALGSAAFGDPSPGDDTGDRTLASSTNEALCFKASLDVATDDDYQGASTVTTFTFQAEQTANNN